MVGRFLLYLASASFREWRQERVPLLTCYRCYQFHGDNPNDHSKRSKVDEEKVGSNAETSAPDSYNEKKDSSDNEKKDPSDKPKKKRKRHHRKYTDDTSPEDQKLLDESTKWELGRSPSTADVKKKRAEAAKKMVRH